MSVSCLLGLLVCTVVVLLVGEAGLPAVAAAYNSSCQALDPSPYLEKFVDALPVPPTINVSAGVWVKIGAYKIKQVGTYSFIDHHLTSA